METGLKYLVIKVCRTVLGKAVRIISSEGKSIAPCLRSRALRVLSSDFPAPMTGTPCAIATAKAIETAIEIAARNAKSA